MNELGPRPTSARDGSGFSPAHRHKELVRPALYAGTFLLILFTSYELAERAWLAHSPYEHVFHIARGVISSLVVGLIVGWTILKTSPSILPVTAREPGWGEPRRLGNAERTHIYARWFVAMRWLAVLVAGIIILISVKIADLLPENTWVPLVVIVGILALSNLIYTALLRTRGGDASVLLAQGYIDLIILTGLLHFSGGIENPLSPIMIFHVIIGGILLSRSHCYGIAAAGSVLFGVLAWAEFGHIWEHQSLRVFPPSAMPGGEMFHAAHQPLYVSSRVLLQTAILFLTAYFVTSLSERIRHHERRLETMAERAFADRQLLEGALETTGAALRVCNRHHEPYWSSKWWKEWFICQAGDACRGCGMLDRDDESMQHCLADGQTRVTELVLSPRECPSRLVQPGAPERVFQITTAPLLDGNGQVMQVVELAQEVTRQKQTQIEMMRAGKLAAVGELAGHVAHEINNPTAIIIAKSSLLLSDHHSEMSPKVGREVVKIKELAERVAKIAQGLLSYCRPSTATRTLVDVRAPIRKSLGMIEEHAKRSGVILSDQLDGGEVLIRANSQELEQVFLNLFLNALDAMPNGGRLTVRRSSECEIVSASCWVNVTVEDTGIGIPEGIRDRIFDPFFTTKQDGRGTGLGLSICLGLVRSHGGDIEVESETGKGTRVRVRLPMVQQSRRAELQHV